MHRPFLDRSADSEVFCRCLIRARANAQEARCEDFEPRQAVERESHRLATQRSLRCSSEASPVCPVVDSASPPQEFPTFRAESQLRPPRHSNWCTRRNLDRAAGRTASASHTAHRSHLSTVQTWIVLASRRSTGAKALQLPWRGCREHVLPKRSCPPPTGTGAFRMAGEQIMRDAWLADAACLPVPACATGLLDDRCKHARPR